MYRIALLVLASCAAHEAGALDASTHDGSDAAPSDAPKAGADAGQATHAVSIIVEPNGNHAQELVDEIKLAHSSVYMTMYELSSSAITNALTARVAAGVSVQVILDGANKPFNQGAYDKLTAAGASVIWSSTAFTFTHEKAVIIDGAVVWIMTMNATQTSADDNREYLARDADAADVAEATAIFKADHALQSITPNGSLVVANANARQDLVALIGTATTSLYVEGEEFSDTNGIVAAVAQAAQRGVDTRIVIANGGLDAPSVKTVKSAGANVVMTGPASGSGNASHPYIHAKAISIDGGKRAFVGSENFSAGSLGYNRELGVIFDDPTETAKVNDTIAADFAAGVAQ